MAEILELEPQIAEAEVAKHEQLRLLRDSLWMHTYPGYPEAQNRFHCSPEDSQLIADGVLGIPKGSWDHKEHVNLPTEEEKAALTAKGLALDLIGRPLHPWFVDMASNPEIGTVSGRGEYWYWGPNYTADPIVVCNEHILLIKREDTGLWALPGGHLDPAEQAEVAALRELEEETGLELPAESEGKLIYSGPVADLRATAHAWPETTAILYELVSEELPPVQGRSDAKEAVWVPIELLGKQTRLYGSHNFLVEQALRQRY